MSPDKTDVVYGTLALMILKTLDTLGSLHGYGLARRVEQISGNQLALNQGTLYPALLKLEQLGWLRARWGESDTGRRAKFYTITRAGRAQLHADTESWKRTTNIVARFLNLPEEIS